MIGFNEFLSAVKRLARFGRDHTTLLIVVLAGLGTAHILVRTATYGAGVDRDATFFLSTALNFLAGEGWRDFIGRPLTLWPPLFPLLLAASSWVGIDPLATGRWVNATAFGLTILAAGCWLRSHLRSQWLVLAATALLATSLPLSHWAPRIRTDPLFILFALLALIQLASFLNRKTAWPPLLWAAVFTALAAITRYPGVVLIGVGVLLLLLLVRLRHTLVFGAISSVPLLAVLVRNWAVTGNLTRATGDRTPTDQALAGDILDPSGQSLADGLRQTVEEFREWIVPRNMPDGVAYLMWLAVAAVVLASAVVILRGRRPDPEAAPTYLRLGPVLPFGVFALSYPTFLIVVVPFTVTQIIDSRYLLPIYVPLLLTAVFLLDRFLSIEAAGRTGAVRYGLVPLVLLATLAHVGFSTRENFRLTAQAYATGFLPGYTYNSARWQQSKTLNYLRDNRIEGTIYSNGYKDLTWFWDRTAAPGKHRNIPEAMGWAEIEAGAHILWFQAFHYRGFYGYDDLDLRALSGMETLADLADGVVFRRTTAEPFDAKRHRARKQRYVQQLIQQADERVIRAGWSVYRTTHKLIYFKEPCVPADVQAKFVLHVVPTDLADLPAHRQQHGSENLDFYFDWRGSYLGDQCVAIVRLPAYAIDRIHIGQWISAEDRTLWEVELTPSR